MGIQTDGGGNWTTAGTAWTGPMDEAEGTARDFVAPSLMDRAVWVTGDLVALSLMDETLWTPDLSAAVLVDKVNCLELKLGRQSTK